MKFISWNVNGLRACVNKGFLDSFYELDADFFCLQETKLQEGQISLELPGYHQFWCSAEKKGYSGTAIFAKYEPRNVYYGLGVPELDTEGRLITLEYDEFYLVTCYTPNAQRGLARIEHRLKWEAAFADYLQSLDQKKPVILCGDLNVAHKEIDLKNPGSNRGNAGFSDEEREAFSKLLSCGFTDTFRHLYPDVTGAYSWWSYMFNARANNAGWRIDYFIVSDRLQGCIHDATIHPDIMGSDHCPVGLDLNITCNGSILSPETHRPADNESKMTDVDSPVGHFRLAMLALIPAAILSVPLILMLIPKPETTPPPTTSTHTTAPTSTDVSADLIRKIIDRSANGKLDTIYSGSTDPAHPETPVLVVRDGTGSWTLEDVANLISHESKRADLPAGSNCNYFLQVIFTEQYDPDRMIKPKISIQTGSNDSLRLYTAYYKDSTGRIAGCFVYGYSNTHLQLQISAALGFTSETALSPVVVPRGMFDLHSTIELVDMVQESGAILDAMTRNDSPYANPIDELVASNPYVIVLLRRSDAIRVLLDRFSGTHETGSVTFLLTNHQFRGMMTAEEWAEFQQKIGEIIYGSSEGIIIPP